VPKGKIGVKPSVVRSTRLDHVQYESQNDRRDKKGWGDSQPNVEGMVFVGRPRFAQFVAKTVVATLTDGRVRETIDAVTE